MRARATILFLLLALPATLFAAPKFFLEQDMCVRCHLLGGNLGAENPVILWRRSAHYRPDSGCADCHGGDKYLYIDYEKGHAGLPDRARTLEDCGRCHAAEKADALEKPAGEPGEFNCSVNCADCHGYHYVPEADVSLLNERRCGRCHPFGLVEPHKLMADGVAAATSAVEKKIALYEDQSFPVQSVKRKLDAIRKDFTSSFHSRPPERIRESSLSIIESIKGLLEGMEDFSPRKFRFSGAVIISFLVVLLVLLIGCQRTLDSERQTGKEGGEMADDNGLKSQERRTGSAWATGLALIIALIALVLVIQERMSSTESAVQSVNQTVTNTVVPQLKKATDRDTVNSIYELKRMVITLDEIKETSDNEEVRAMIDKMKMDLDELGVKLLVHE
jgi:hypothetical protein